jgi:oligosaccharide repeat unit polymerase
MDEIIKILLFVSFSVFAIGTYVIWPNRFNVFAHLQVGFVFIAYFIPLFFTDVIKHFSYDLVEKYTIINSIGTVLYVAGMIIGVYLPKVRFSKPSTIYNDKFSDAYIFKVIKARSTMLFFVSFIGMVCSFIWMGYIPMFAENPLEAKFFRGSYQDTYSQIAIIYRTSYNILVAILPVLFAITYFFKSKKFLAMSLAAVGICIVTMVRSEAIYAFLMFYGIVLSNKKRIYSWLYILLIIVIFSFGSMSYHLFFMVLGMDSYYNSDSIFDMIASGAPDVMDQLQFFDAFEDTQPFTYGRTFAGGLVPGHYEWNPSVWALDIINAGDLNSVISGGLRLTIPLWGYTAFSYSGVVVLSLLTGILTGYCTKITRILVEKNELIRAIIGVIIFQTIFSQIISFYALSIYNVPKIFAALFLMLPIGLRWSRRSEEP